VGRRKAGGAGHGAYNIASRVYVKIDKNSR
jgi:hypothetical protein